MAQMIDVAATQERQRALLPDVYAGKPKAVLEYDDTVLLLMEALGIEAHVGQVSAELYQTFSDCWKDEYGCRPRHHVTVADAWAYVERFRLPE